MKPCMKILALLTLSVLLVGCSRQPPVKEPPPTEVVVSQPVNESIEDWDVFTGTVESKDAVNITSRVRGQIEAVKFTDGDEIKEGAPLFEIDAEPFKADLQQAKGQLTTWEAKLKLADERIGIYKPLADKGTVSREELLSAMASRGEAVGSIEVAKGKIREANKNIDYCNIKSPISGRVSEALLTKGNLVNASGAETLLTTVVPVDPMYVKFNVNEQALRNYEKVLAARAEKNQKNGKDTKIVIPLGLALLGDTGFPHKGFVDFVDNRIDPATSSRKVRGRFENPKLAGDRRVLTAGMFARIKVSIAEAHPAMLVAARAILTDQDMKYVLVVNKSKNNTVERVEVTVSRRVQDNGLQEVTGGLKGDEWIVVEGVNRVRPGVKVDPKDDKMPRRPTSGN